MPRGVKKQHLPSKVCVVCERPFTWRKKWEAVWDEVTTCSKSCNSKRRSNQQKSNKQEKLNLLQTDDATSEPFVKETRQQLVDVVSAAPDDNSKRRSESSSSTATVEDDDDDDDNDTDTVKTDNDDDEIVSQLDAIKAARKAAKKLAKAELRARRQGADLSHGQKDCTICDKSVDLLIRCTVDASQEWKMVCGTCWTTVSGGVADGDIEHPHYRYGGLWKNRARR
jgi:hypothetical protein